MVDVEAMPDNAFGYVPTPAIVAPIEFTLRLSDFERLGGHTEAVVDIEAALAKVGRRVERDPDLSWPIDNRFFAWTRK